MVKVYVVVCLQANIQFSDLDPNLQVAIELMKSSHEIRKKMIQVNAYSTTKLEMCAIFWV